MRLRFSSLVVPVLAGLIAATVAPVQAAPTDPVTNLAATAVQTPGANDSWNVVTSWTANPDATTYSVVIADHADGSVTSGKAYGNKDTTGTATSLTSDNLVASQTYWIAVQPIAPSVGAVVTTEFVPPALDTTPPNGTYKLSRTSAFLVGGDPFGTNRGKATISITQTSIDTGAVTRKVLPGDGTATKTWTSSGSFALTYAKPGKFTPKVRLTDEFGNARDVVLPTVWIREDTIAPTIKITRPVNPTKVASWRAIRGTASDVGVGLEVIGAFVIEKRGSLWWSYDFGRRKWLKGYATISKTISRSPARPAFMTPTASGAWRTPFIRGLTKGTLHVEAVALDKNLNDRLVMLNQRIR